MDRDTQQGRMLMEDEGRDQDDTSTSQGRRKTIHKPPEAMEGPGTDSPPRPLEGTDPADTLISDMQAPDGETIHF